MSSLYIREQGANVRKSGETIEIVKQNQRLLTYPVANIDGLSLFGNIQISMQALNFLLENGVDVNLFTRNGTLVGQVLADRSKNIFLRFAQFDAYQDATTRLKLGCTIIRNKIDNQIEVTNHYRYKDGYSPKDVIEKMQKLKEELNQCTTSNEIMGIEGMCSNLYFTAFSHMIDCKYQFNGRNRRPPKDPINVILSLGYTFLTREVSSALEAESFEAYLGFLHGIRYGRKSLALDIVEEFRQPVVDRFVVRVFNKRIINEFDFEIEDDQVTLTEEGFRKFCQEFEKWITGSRTVQNQNYRKIIRDQASKLKHAMLDKMEYVPYKWKQKTWEEDNALCD